jgi:hypothetical protein
MKSLSNLDLSQNELQNARIQNLASDPGSPVNGQIWYNTTSNVLKYRNNAANIDPLARGTHTGTQLAATISDLASTVQAYRLDQFAAPTASVTLNSQRITNLGAPSVSTDACTKGYVDTLVNGADWKQSCRMATTANVTLSGLQTIDGISGSANDRVLVKNQATASQNGIWLMQSGAWTRAADADAGTLTANAAVFVSEGSTQADTQWILSTNDAITVGTTALSWTQLGAGSSYSQGTGISISGSVISIDTAVVPRKFASTIGDGSSTSIAVTHSLGTQDVTWSVRQVSDNAYVICDAVSTSTSVLTLSFAVAPSSNSLRVTVIA